MNWQPDLIWLHVISDSLISLAYLCIPLALLYFVRRRRDMPFHWMFVAFAAFILSCGATHIMGVVTLWRPYYWVDGSIKLMTAVASIVTAVCLYRLIPTLLQIPSRQDLSLAQQREAESTRLNLRLEDQLARERDLAERLRKADDGLRQSLLEKETLLKEMHHRVKNNLFVMSSLLSMQANSLEEERAINALRDSERRVLSMALIHDRLYHNDEMSAVKFDDYCQLLGNDLAALYVVTKPQVTIRYELTPIYLAVEQAIPCGLILNELVTNALKYAYVGNRTGEICVHLERMPENRVLLRISDEGVGLPSTFNLEEAKSLGLQIVHLLSMQLDGTLRIISPPGTVVELEFPLSVSVDENDGRNAIATSASTSGTRS
jgi:two-component sensor histidine kinase